MSIQKTIGERITHGRDSGEETDAIISELYSDGIGITHLLKALKAIDGLPGKEALALVLSATETQRKLDEATNFREAGEDYCPRCGEPIFRFISGETTHEQLKGFIKSSPAFDAHERTIDGKLKLLPGEYCPNGCTDFHYNSGPGDLWERMEQNRQEVETSAISIINHVNNRTQINRFKIYLDRYIRRTSNYDSNLKPVNGEYLTMAPGKHTVVVRDYEVHDPDRRETNTIDFSIGPNERIEFIISENRSGIRLERA